MWLGRPVEVYCRISGVFLHLLSDGKFPGKEKSKDVDPCSVELKLGVIVVRWERSVNTVCMLRLHCKTWRIYKEAPG